MFVSIISQVTPSELSVLKKVAMEPLFLTHLREHLSIKGVRRVVLHEPLSNLRKVIFVQYAQGTPRTEVWRGLHGASTLLADCGKICVAVSEDIDPTNTDAVFWSLAYRSNPVDDVHIAPHRSAGHGPKSGPRSEESTILIDATLSTRRRRSRCPRASSWSTRAASGRSSGLPSLAPQPPWHGYSLGDWSEKWDVYAARAVAGKWEESGAETFARRRGGLIPETPVREVEGKKSGLGLMRALLRPQPEEHPCKSLDLHGCVSKARAAPLVPRPRASRRIAALPFWFEAVVLVRAAMLLSVRPTESSAAASARLRVASAYEEHPCSSFVPDVDASRRLGAARDLSAAVRAAASRFETIAAQLMLWMVCALLLRCSSA